MTTFEEFRAQRGKGNVIPVFDIQMADTETPVSVYLKIKNESPYSFLLESVEGGATMGRYSFVGFNPFMKFTVHGRRYQVDALHDDVVVMPSLLDPHDSPLNALQKLLGHIRTAAVEGLPRFIGGAVGYVGYETASLIENVPVVDHDELNVPDTQFLFYDVVIIFDNMLRRMILVSLAYLPEEKQSESDVRREYEKAVGEIVRVKALMERPVESRLATAKSVGPMEFVMTREEFCSRVERTKEYIRAGDIFQAVLSQRLRQKVDVRPFDVYRMLRVINPSPYMYYLALDDVAIIGSSPEMLVRVERGVVETRPLAGTRRRGRPEEDRELERELLADEKERAEHLMLVDLGRNDIGRISEYGSVTVADFMSIERYSHVMHLVSRVQGRLRKGCSALDALIACFPAGTLTGAPKIRAMEIIAELEPVKRGIYGGAIAYLDFSGNLDSCIAIRTIVAKNGTLYFQAGAGIVFDSRPEREFEETLEKLQANLKALEMLAS